MIFSFSSRLARWSFLVNGAGDHRRHARGQGKLASAVSATIETG
jgi:hypothetical protein